MCAHEGCRPEGRREPREELRRVHAIALGPWAGSGLRRAAKCSMLSQAVNKKINNLVQVQVDGKSAPLNDETLAQPLFGLDRAGLRALVESWGEPGFRAAQLAEALYHQRVEEIGQISTLPKGLRECIEAEGWQVGRPRIAQVFSSVDGTERYLIRCPGVDESGDGSEADDAEGASAEQKVLSVRSSNTSAVPHPFRRFHREMGGKPTHNLRAGSISPENSLQRPEKRATICVSSQVGCAVNCQFCLTARMGFERNLTAGEIAGQVIDVLARHDVEVGRDRINIVFMGMGEPFLNYENFRAAVRLLVEEVGLSAQRMTVSTSGIVPGIEQFALEPAEFRPKLAISLNAPNDQIRSEVMPINRKWPIDAVVAAVKQVRLRPRERVTFEYVLLGGVTDRVEDARQVARLARRTGLPVKVNLIAWNPGPGIAYAMPQPDVVERFKQTLIGEGVPVYLRRPRGRDIYAACGQLKRTVEG